MTLIQILRFIPSFIWPIKRVIIKKSLGRCGQNVRMGPNTQIGQPKMLSIGNNCFLNDEAYISSVVPIKIGDNVMFGPQVMILGGDHNISEVGRAMIEVKEGGVNTPIEIEDDVWVGARSVILKGVTVREGSVIGASSLVTKPTLPYSVNVGSPSKFVKSRFSLTVLESHLSQVKSKYSLDEIKQMYTNAGVTFSPISK